MESSEPAEKGDTVLGWIVIVLIAMLVVAWGLLAFALVRDVPRAWHYGALPDTPGESVYSSNPTPDATTPPPQIAPLPEAQPKSKTGGRP
jgi:hypothetical protein